MTQFVPWELIDFDPLRLPELGFPRPPMPAFDRPKTGRVAAIVTCHNYGAYLRECLDSLLAQTVRPCEILLVDDASTDENYRIKRGSGVEQIAGSGFGCLVLRREVIDRYAFQIPPGERWYDPVFFDTAVASRGRSLIDWELECEHVGVRRGAA